MAASTSTVIDFLRDADVPVRLVERLLSSGPPLWREQPARILAADIALCHPPPSTRHEVRVRVDPARLRRHWEISVVARDRTGLLARTAQVLARNELSVLASVAASWRSPDLAIQRFQVVETGGHGIDPPTVADEVRIGLPVPTETDMRVPRVGKVRMIVEPLGHDRNLLAVFAPESTGFLWRLCRAIEHVGADIELASVASIDGRIEDLLLVRGALDTPALTAALDVDATEITVATGDARSPAATMSLVRVLARNLTRASMRTQSLYHDVYRQRRLALERT